MYFNATLSICPTRSFTHSVHKSVHVCVSTAALWIGSSVPSFYIPYACILFNKLDETMAFLSINTLGTSFQVKNSSTRLFLMPVLYYYMNTPKNLFKFLLKNGKFFPFFIAMNIPIPKSFKISLKYFWRTFKIYLEYLEYSPRNETARSKDMQHLLWPLIYIAKLLLQRITWKLDLSHQRCCCYSLQSCPTQRDPTDGSPPGSPVPGILQARTLEWLAISFSNAWK